MENSRKFGSKVENWRSGETGRGRKQQWETWRETGKFRRSGKTRHDSRKFRRKKVDCEKKQFIQKASLQRAPKDFKQWLKTMEETQQNQHNRLT
jgi:hypothetical protein